MTADAIVPDDKDWTWVLEQACDCGVDSREIPGSAVAGLLPGIVQRWQGVLARPAAELMQRPEPSVWSPLEYSCHVRDVFGVFGGRFALMLAEDGPEFENWDQDATARASDYPGQDPSAVAASLAAEASAVEQTLAGVREDQWDRVGYRSNGSVFTVDSLARYFVHDVLHHLHDVRA